MYPMIQIVYEHYGVFYIGMELVTYLVIGQNFEF